MQHDPNAPYSDTNQHIGGECVNESVRVIPQTKNGRNGSYKQGKEKSEVLIQCVRGEGYRASVFPKERKQESSTPLSFILTAHSRISIVEEL